MRLQWTDICCSVVLVVLLIDYRVLVIINQFSVISELKAAASELALYNPLLHSASLLSGSFISIFNL